jgi:predicted RecB family endonuclease
MVDIIASVKGALGVVQRLKEVSDKLHDAETQNLIGDLNLKLAEIKTLLAEVIDENTELKAKVKRLESADGDPCPRCRKRTWVVVSSQPDPVMGELGAIRRTYQCSSCGLSESQMFTAR